jgi:hypothetical protein
LVLYLTSHGRDDGAISIRERDRRDGLLRPNTLRTALDDSGIRRRLVIVSACYSGSFVPALGTDDTIVVTAAAFARTSFGCEAQRDWTILATPSSTRRCGRTGRWRRASTPPARPSRAGKRATG